MHRYFVAFEVAHGSHKLWGPQVERQTVVMNLNSPVQRTEDLRDIETGLAELHGRRVTITALTPLPGVTK